MNGDEGTTEECSPTDGDTQATKQHRVLSSFGDGCMRYRIHPFPPDSS